MMNRHPNQLKAPISLNKIFQLILLIAVCFLLPGHLLASQLIEKTSSVLEGDWTVCVVFENKSSECQKQKTAFISNTFTEPVKAFIYTKNFIVSSELQLRTLGIKLNIIDDVDEVKINNHLIGKTGKFPPNFESAFQYDRHYLIPAILLNYNKTNILEITTFSSINKPGINNNPVIITDYIKVNQYQNKISYLYIVFLAVFILLMLFQLFYYFMVKESYETIYLSIYFFAFSLVTFARSNAPIYLELDLSSTYRIEIFMLATAIISFSFFIFRFFDLQIKKIYLLAMALMAIPVIINIIYQNSLMTRLFSEFSYWLICLFSFFTICSALILAACKKLQYNVLVATLSTVCWITLCLDAASHSDTLLNLNFNLPLYIVPLVAMLMGITMSLTITHKYWNIFKGATYDHLTGTLLRPAFFQRLSEEMNISKKNNSLLLVAVINIQEVNNISSNYGKVVGDDLLVLVSNILSKSLKPFDLISYFNDEEFCIAANVASKQDAEDYLQKMHLYLESTQQYVNNETQLFINAKIAGVIFDSEQHLSVSQLLQDAHYGLQQIKKHTTSDYLLLNATSQVI